MPLVQGPHLQLGMLRGVWCAKGLVKINRHLVGLEPTTFPPYEALATYPTHKQSHTHRQNCVHNYSNSQNNYNSLLKFPLLIEYFDQSELAKLMMGPLISYLCKYHSRTLCTKHLQVYKEKYTYWLCARPTQAVLCTFHGTTSHRLYCTCPECTHSCVECITKIIQCTDCYSP